MHRTEVHEHLTGAAHALRLARPGMSQAEAFELACLREPELARHLQAGLPEGAGTDLTAGETAPDRSPDDLSERFRRYVRNSAGRIDLARLRALALANGCWLPRYEELTVPSQVASVLCRLRLLPAKGRAVVFP